MDPTNISSRIKTIIEPYEKKIKDLEEQLRQKDFEIAVLKEKTFQLGNNPSNNDYFQMNQMNMPMGMGMGMPMGMNMGMPAGMGMPMGMNMGMPTGMDMPMGMNQNYMDIFNMNINQKEDQDIVTIFFKFTEEDEIDPIKQRCFIDDEFGYVQKKVLKKLNYSGELKFTYNGKPIIQKMTISELGIQNKSNIFIIHKQNEKITLKEEKEEEANIQDKINIIFNTTQGTTHSMVFDINTSIGLTIEKYLKRVGREI